jgi:hypothetical protein
MKLGIMQPYFFPYLGYFSLMKNTDAFILLDTVQFIKHGWIERNRVLHPNTGWLYIRVPLIRYSHETLIKDIRIDNSQDWKQRIRAQLQHYKRIAPHYFKVVRLLNELFEKDFESIVSLNREALIAVCQYLHMDKERTVFSEMNLSIDAPQAPDEWALNICKSYGNVTEYWNPPGGQSFFDKSKYEKAGIGLKFQKVVLDLYDQKRTPFEAGLSIIDVMMFNSPDEINAMLDRYEVI